MAYRKIPVDFVCVGSGAAPLLHDKGDQLSVVNCRT